ncbi:hypothetical protein FHX42_005273 [Saccharopolyspora lacisalsi]|uniref:Uncharacterized protein n=1 Tax=Halosaccharopolyspora lacisalsi TaxID=1000566 RepID=A0A839E5G4_9PSEU|nr:hypothetical protein [Halosaccharopolyspora lacisalsi]MBA8827866.1 hypothetical protein [Halosaccharopolyspora lacisalsi]
MLERVDVADLNMRYQVAVHTRDRLHTEGSTALANRYKGRIEDLISEFEHRGIQPPALSDD